MEKTIVNQSKTNALHPFVHLHTHTEYSLSDGLSKIDALVEKAIADGMPGMAITDHANMFGICEFVECVNRKNAAKNTNFKPIIGCEFYVARRGMEHKSEREDFAGYHLVLLAKNYIGYQNLIRLVSRAWIDGFCGRPRTDRADLERYHEGLICSSACIGGEVAQHILNDRLAEAEESAMWYKNLFGDDYYFELHRHKATVERANHNIYNLESRVNAQLLALSQKLGIKVICANDAHFVNEEDAEVQDTLLCISWRKKYDDPARLVFSKQEWLKTTAEMNKLFADIPEALDNTIEILNKVERFSIEHAPILPKATLPEGVDEVEHLARLSFEGAYKRFGKPLPEGVKVRLKEELKTINTRSLPAYFLLWHEIFSAARQLGAQIGPGRGSMACSLVAYCLGFTPINPLEWGLSFSQFLNPEHSLLPKIEMELDEYGRERVVAWLKGRFGAESIANIVSFDSFSEKELTRVAERVYSGFPTREYDLAVAVTKRLERVKKGASLHSCSLALCSEPITKIMPVAVLNDEVTGEPTIVTQYGGQHIETARVVKLDILSNTHLEVIKRTVESILLSRGIEVDVENIPKKDPKTFELLCKGATSGIFQFEGKEVQKLLVTAQPKTLEELVNLYSMVCSSKAHAISYVRLAYQTAYLKALYPAEYMAALCYCYRHTGWRHAKYSEGCENIF